MLFRNLSESSIIIYVKLLYIQDVQNIHFEISKTTNLNMPKIIIGPYLSIKILSNLLQAFCDICKNEATLIIKKASIKKMIL